MSLFFGRRGEQRAMTGGWVDAGDGPGRAVTEDNATRLAPVFAAHRHIVDYIATLPLDCFRKEGDRRVALSLPAVFANTDIFGMSGLVPWLGQAAYGLACGNAVGWNVAFDGYGYPVDVRWLHWSQWSFDEQAKQWYVAGRPVPLERITHIPWIVPPGKTLGLSPIEHYASIARAGLSAQDYGDVTANFPPAWFKNTAKTVSPDQSQDVSARLAASMSRHRPLVTGKDWDFTAIAIPPNQAQFVETQKLTANQIAAIYGIDPTEIGGTAANSLTYSTEELRQINRAANMRPYLVRLEAGFARLLPLKQFVKFTVDATMRVDAKTRTEIVGAQIKDGRMSVDEARALEDRGPVPGGDRYNVPAPKADPTTREGDTP